MKHTIKRTIQYISRSRGLSLATIVVMASSFFVTSVFVVASYGSYKILDFFQSRAQISAYFKDDATEADIMGVKSRLEASGKVQEVVYTSKEEALKIYVQRFNEDPALLESIAANILPASLDVRAKDPTQLTEIANQLRQEILVEDVTFREDVLGRLLKITNTAQVLEIFLVILQLFTTVFVTIVTIALVIHSRKDEIEIMQLVGATRWQIRWPFVLQGVLYGFFGAAISAALVAPALPQIMPSFVSYLLGSELLNIISPLVLGVLVGGQILLGMLLGGFGSFLATWRYLK